MREQVERRGGKGGGGGGGEGKRGGEVALSVKKEGLKYIIQRIKRT